jgi:hypothetical protein
VKALSVILALFVTALSIMPCCIDCDADNDKVITEQAPDNDCADECSPFYSCANCCVGFALNQPTLVTGAIDIQSVLPFTDYKQPLQAYLNYSIWQPPKLG